MVLSLALYGVYTGSAQPQLHGKRATISLSFPNESGEVFAQFDDIEATLNDVYETRPSLTEQNHNCLWKLGYGWTQFNIQEFTLLQGIEDE